MSMEKINRKKGPRLQGVADIQFPSYSPAILDNGMHLYSLLEGEVPVASLTLIFGGGRTMERKHFEALGAMMTMPRGTAQRSESELFEQFDRMGSRLGYHATGDASIVRVRSVTSQLLPTLSLLMEILQSPAYTEKSVRNWCRQHRAQLEVDFQQPSLLADMALFNALYAPSHPYARHWRVADLDALESGDMRAYHARSIGSGNCLAILAGGVDVETLDAVHSLLGGSRWGVQQEGPSPPMVDFSARSGYAVKTPSPMENQVSIQLGRLLPSIPFEGLLDLDIAVSLLGGFFGSRLVKNLREDKGYTYGIGAGIRHALMSSHLKISTEVGNQHAADSVKEIAREMHRMQETLVSQEELSVLRGYLLGASLRSFDGPLKSAHSLVPLVLYPGLPRDWFRQSFSRIHSITPEEIREAARRWLSPRDFVLSVSGGSSVIAPIAWPVMSL